MNFDFSLGRYICWTQQVARLIFLLLIQGVDIIVAIDTAADFTLSHVNMRSF